MNKKLKILLSIFLIIILGIFIYEEYFLTKRYEFKIDNYQINVKADECETCYLDWTINNYIKISDLTNKTKTTIEFYTEGPRLEFGLNADKTELIINCPGFDTKIVDLTNLKEIEFVDYNEMQSKISDFEIMVTINRKKELFELEHPQPPSIKWE
ncbi:hypothetical protein A7A78_08590 [Aequorivita soesokkakensis]|uniref:Uncharacterized protein n=1 Tax=Aequorivita soesokkakensis TaxID=1385699 RepID=A0A1A9LHC2_9FLAO|nr:hypothetical protein A7A78_08590 [Aequorivita soesokkakensis]